MLEHLKGIKWVGDLSLQDADLLAKFGKQSENVLEFGAGGSTMIFAQTAKNVMSVETEVEWFDVVSKRLKSVGCDNVKMMDYTEYLPYLKNNNILFDVIFVDCHTSRRAATIKHSWRFLKEGGSLLIHDTRKSLKYKDIQHPYATIFPFLFETHFVDIRKMDVCAEASDGERSNTTVITKGRIPDYVNWQNIENKPKWAYGSDMSVIDDLWQYEE